MQGPISSAELAAVGRPGRIFFKVLDPPEAVALVRTLPWHPDPLLGQREVEDRPGRRLRLPGERGGVRGLPGEPVEVRPEVEGLPVVVVEVRPVVGDLPEDGHLPEVVVAVRPA